MIKTVCFRYFFGLVCLSNRAFFLAITILSRVFLILDVYDISYAEELNIDR